jgi:ankyrin repeat protein
MIWNSISGNDGKSLLKAAGTGDYQQVGDLLETDIDINYQDESGRTALYFATMGGQ